jgi:hypothetical protein
MARKLRYSERQRLAATGSLGPLLDAPSEEVRNAIINLMRRGFESPVGNSFEPAFRHACIEEFGWTQYQGEKELRRTVRELGTEKFLEFVEVLVEECIKKYRRYTGGRYVFEAAIEDAGMKVNDLFERHRFSYRIEKGEIRKIGSPALDEAIVGPALLAVQRSGWDEAERSFKEALNHQRGPESENDDALTAANAALEAALKAAGYKGSTLGALSKDFRNNGTVPPELKGVPESLEQLLNRSMAIRSSYGDSHGKAAGAVAVPDGLVALAINLVGTFVVYIADETPSVG